ncbi:MAG TPA: thiamine phosphate synthase [Vicinamibacterales bacterium]
MTSLTPPLICVVSDRTRTAEVASDHAEVPVPPAQRGAVALDPLVPVPETVRPASQASPFAPLVNRLALAARAGADLIQVREPDLSGRELFQLISELIDATRGSSARILVNDRLDVALASGAHGVHLKDESMDTARVRALVPAGFIVGRSVHTKEAAVAAAAAGADYLVFGTVFPTRSKAEGHPVAGLDALAAVTRAVAVPVLAIGGMTTARAPAVAAAGAAGIAAIGLFLEPSGSPEQIERELRRTIDAVRKAFRAGGAA